MHDTPPVIEPAVTAEPNTPLMWLNHKWVRLGIVGVVILLCVIMASFSLGAKAGVITLKGVCLDNSAGRVTDGNRISVWKCHSGTPQQWSVGADGTIKTQGHCLDIPASSKKSQVYVQLWTCNGSKGQKWTIKSNGAIVNPNSGLCLDDKGGITTNGNGVWMWPCNNTAAQKWTLSSGAKPPVSPSKPPVVTAPTPPPATTACSPIPVALSSATKAHTTNKKVFAFYFPPFPVSIENKAPATDSYSKWQYSLNAKGGAYDLRDRPIGRTSSARSDWKQADFEVEIRRAIEVGIDGFIWEYHTSSDARWNQLPAMLAAAKAVDPTFKIQLSPDFSLASGATPDSVVTDVLKVKNDASIYKTSDGSIVLSPFYPERQPVSFWDSLKNKLNAQGVKTALVPMFLSWSGSASEKSEWKGHVYGYSQWGTRSTSGIATLSKNANEAHARGGIWMQPIAFEDTRSYDGRFWESSNSSLLRQSFESAISNNADWITLNTWNDYTESWLSPSTERGYAVTDVASYYIEWFKTGKKPAVVQDALYWFHRSQKTNAAFATQPIGRNGQKISMSVPNGNAASDEVELVAFLKTPGKLVITQGSVVKEMDAAAGPVSFKVPIIAGTTPVFSLQRSGKTVQTVTSDTPIKTNVTFQDMMYHAGGGVAVSCKRP